MTLIQRRFKAVIERLGDTFTVGAVAGKALVAPLAFEDAQTYLTSAELAAAGLPIWALYVPFDDVTPAGATLTWNGVSYTVQRAIDWRFQDAAALRLLIAA